MLIVIRHGETGFNENGQERLRGWLPIPLTLEGMQASRKTAEEVADRGDNVKEIFCSTLLRAVQSAEEVGFALEMPITPVDWLKDFNTGELAGTPITPTVIEQLHEYLKEPTKVIPEGERFLDFLDRVSPMIKQYIEEKDIYVAVTHGRVTTLIMALAEAKGGKPKLSNLMKKPPIGPSGHLIVNSDWSVEGLVANDKSSARIS